MQTWDDIRQWYLERNCFHAANHVMQFALFWSTPADLTAAIESGLELCKKKHSAWAVRDRRPLFNKARRIKNRERLNGSRHR